ncbi:SDR family NAD(P)-dependent oxidoreductase [Pontibacter diazotrophicus]|uniref:SDR family NAD(P)-dependent oxidoreductase n=1 Tax=Pontibacter diazotrophicus TaxID=1400979 RepID=A0A3D8L3I0_9BACT|nr:SDR family oxidoreductase [Pontibacter diazotrophicus]RDV11981.1 SDR family NAD(P)-dependent oxidoreductase [Pontibacter diazotrophicus]
MTQLRNSTILITGGASGIGRLMGLLSLQRGAKQLIIWDINRQNLLEVTAELQAMGYPVLPYEVDVANTAAVEAAAKRVLQETGPPDILINNAGIVVGKVFAAHSYADIANTLNINVLGVMAVTRAFLPAIIERGSGHVVNIASAASLIPNPRMSVYAASKWAVLGWSESFRLELEALKLDLHVTTVTPSYIDTGMFAGAKAPLLTPVLQPEEVADAILKAVEKNKILLRKPFIVHLIPLLRGLLPTRLFDLFVGRGFKAYSTMEGFVGHPANKTVPRHNSSLKV